MKTISLTVAAALLTGCATSQQLAQRAGQDCAAIGRNDRECMEYFYLRRHNDQRQTQAAVIGGVVLGVAGAAVAASLPRPAPQPPPVVHVYR